MKKTILIAAMLLAALAPLAAKKKTTHTIMTANVRVTGLEADEQPGLRWDDRKDICRDVILSRKPDIICMQEVIYDSWNYFKKELKGYTAFGFEGPEMDPYKDGLTKAHETKISQFWIDFYKMMLSHHEDIIRVNFWCLNDANSWRNDFPIKGRTDYATLFDRQSRMKPFVKDLINLVGAGKAKK